MKTNYFLFLLLLLLPVYSTAQDSYENIQKEKKKKQSLLSLMDYEEIFPVTVTADIMDLIDNKHDQRERSGLFNFTDSLGQKFSLPIRLETRGKSRLVRCEVPPVMIYFDKQALEEQRIKDYPKLKVVVPCFKDAQAEDLLYRELLVYKLYALVSDFHFRVQATELICMDTSMQDTTHIIPAFFIESDKEFRKRTDTEELSEYSITWEDLESEQAQITALFQYMVGNTDWKIEHKHNLKYFRNDEDTPLVLVPYDFDFSGFVNADYAKPNPDYRQRHVRERIYMGKKNEFLDKTIRHFIDKETEILQTITDDPHLSASSKEDLKKFLAPFFKKIKNKRAARRIFRNFNQ